MDLDLPVWTIRPNWSQGIVERLEWLTNVLTSDTGVEQRRAIRLSPRRSFEITVNPTRRERTYLDLLLHRLGSEEWLLPLWHDQAALNEKAVVGAQALMIDNTFREFVDGGYAILYLDAFTWEVVEILSQGDPALILAGDVEREWPRGTKVYPLRRATLPAETSMKAFTSRVGESVLLFTTNEANDYPEATTGPYYQGSPLISIEPNRSQEIGLDHVRYQDEQDGEIGLRYRTDRVGRAFGVQSHNWMIRGREAHASFRSLLYALRGRQRMVWLPSFNDDLTLSRLAETGDDEASFDAVGYGYVSADGPIPGRSLFWTGQEVARMTALKAPLGDDEERMALADPLAHDYAPGASWGFLEPARLNQDSIELHHHTDSDGTMECAAGFQTFNNVPVEPLPWYVRITVDIEGAGDVNGLWLFYSPQIQVYPPNGKTYGNYNSIGTGQKEYERNLPNVDPRLQGQLMFECNGTTAHGEIILYYPVPFGQFHSQYSFELNSIPAGNIVTITCQRFGSEPVIVDQSETNFNHTAIWEF